MEMICPELGALSSLQVGVGDFTENERKAGGDGQIAHILQSSAGVHQVLPTIRARCRVRGVKAACLGSCPQHIRLSPGD